MHIAIFLLSYFFDSAYNYHLREEVEYDEGFAEK